MTEFERRPGQIVAKVDKQAPARAGRYKDDNPGANPVEIDPGFYDELDHRLMATFPASDAVARY